MPRSTGRHFLQIPGPTNCPLPVLAAVAMPTIDHRGPEFGRLALDVLANIRTIFKQASTSATDFGHTTPAGMIW